MVKSLLSIPNYNFIMSLCDHMQSSMGKQFDAPPSIHWVFLKVFKVTIYQGAAACISGGTKVGCMLAQKYGGLTAHNWQN